MELKNRFETTRLNDLCTFLSGEITQLSEVEYKLKLMFVLVHLVEECQKALNSIDTDNLTKELQVLVKEACEKSNKQQEINKLRHIQDKHVRDLIDGTNQELQLLDEEIESRLRLYETKLKPLIELRDNLSLLQRETTNNK